MHFAYVVNLFNFFSCICCRLLTFLKSTFSTTKILILEHYQSFKRRSRSGSKCLQGLLADDKRPMNCPTPHKLSANIITLTLYYFNVRVYAERVQYLYLYAKILSNDGVYQKVCNVRIVLFYLSIFEHFKCWI